MSNEKEIREYIKNKINELDDKYLIIDEFCGGYMKTRADLALIKRDSLIFIEIKSNKDTLARLENQIRDYSLYSNNVFLFLDIVHKEKFLKMFETYSGFGKVSVYFWDNGLSKENLHSLGNAILKVHSHNRQYQMFDLLWSKEKDQFISFLKYKTKMNRDKAIKHIFTVNELIELSNDCLYDRTLKNLGKNKKFSNVNNLEFGKVKEIKYKDYKQIIFNDIVNNTNQGLFE